MDKFSAFALLTGGLGATTFSGSITAILINTPGTASNAATVIDGYPLTQQGRAGEAISISAVASATGALAGGVVFLMILPVMLDFVLLFGPGDIFWLIVYAFLVIPLLIGDRPILGIAMAGLGAMFAFMGRAPQTGMPRFTFQSIQLQSGMHIIAVIVGLELALFKFLESRGILTVDWERLTAGLVQASQDAATGAPPSWIMTILSTLSVGAGFTGGFLLGFKKG
jgi:putative tricarboxylic transport membrane protein